ncbi:Ubiquitin carboxyl-terminal hydrolase isozyme L3 [Cladobotryum mycophilum]|uniref:Ubiquitin carboxyl-terminal hydrolase n=1 Tax=Cladobotryum mycophilum TaxID=491253 RepID=A0ABR0SG13_9HYPO
MSTNTNPDPAPGAPAFIPLEANPPLMTSLIHKLGVSEALEIHDVYSLTEPEMLAFIPRPALALLLVFPVSAVYESHRLAEDSLLDEGGLDARRAPEEEHPLPPPDRARVLETTPALATAHREAASAGDTAAPDAQDDVDLHYVCFVKGSDGALWELDGRRKGPLRRGELGADEDVLSERGLAMGALKFLERGGADLRFSAVALAGAVE